MNAGKLFVKVIFVLVSLVLLIGQAQAQDCPPDRVCMTKDQAAHYLTLEDTVKAKDAELVAKDGEIATLKVALADQKNITADVKIELAKTVGEKTGAEQALIRRNAEFEFLLKNGRKKCTLFSICL